MAAGMATVRDGSAFFKRTRVESFEEGQAVSVRENRIVLILDVSDLEEWHRFRCA